MQLWDYLISGVIVSIAVWYLYRKFVVNKGCTCGSSSSCARKTGINCIQKNDSEN